MSTMMMTIYGANEYLKKHANQSIFDLLVLPAGIDKELLCDQIILRSGEFEVLYSNLGFLREAIGVWARTYARTFERWVLALNTEYNPLENYDRIEEWHTDNDFENHTYNHGYVTGNLTNNVSAYDVDTFQPHDQSTSRDDTDMRADNDGEGHEGKTGRAHGNIGVTTSQQMLESELKIAEWNLYYHIADLFIKEFCIPVY